MLYALVRANAAGWGSTQPVGLLALSVALLAGFVLVKSRVATPLVRLTIFHHRHVRSANVAMAGTAAAMVGGESLVASGASWVVARVSVSSAARSSGQRFSRPISTQLDFALNDLAVRGSEPSDPRC